MPQTGSINDLIVDNSCNCNYMLDSGCTCFSKCLSNYCGECGQKCDQLLKLPTSMGASKQQCLSLCRDR